jgi:hypothetical protein
VWSVTDAADAYLAIVQVWWVMESLSTVIMSQAV